MTVRLASWLPYTKNQYTLIEQSQYFQGSIRADPSKLGAVSFANDVYSTNFFVFVIWTGLSLYPEKGDMCMSTLATTLSICMLYVYL